MSRDPRNWMSGAKSAEYGCVCTFENDRGETLSGHRTGPLMAGLRDLIEAAQARDPSYRLTSYSTPTSILSDITGRRTRRIGIDGRPSESALPEVISASRIGRLDAIHPRLRLVMRAHDSTLRGLTQRQAERRK